MTTETTIAAKPTAAQVWQILKPIIFDEWAPPLKVRLHPASISVDIEMAPNDRRAVDKVVDFLGLPPSILHLRHTWSEGQPDEIRVYGHFYDSPGSALLPGWGVTVHCDICTQADASAHWDGLILSGRSRHGHPCFDPACLSRAVSA